MQIKIVPRINMNSEIDSYSARDNLNLGIQNSKSAKLTIKDNILNTKYTIILINEQKNCA